MKSCTYLVNPDGRRVQRVEAPIQTRETLELLLGACPFETLECISLRGELVLIRRAAPGASLNVADAYNVGGHRVLGRSLLCARPKGADAIPSYLSADPGIAPAPLSADEAAALVEWEAPVAGELAGRVLDVQMLDTFAQFYCQRAGAAYSLGVVRLQGIDQAGRPAVAFNVPCADWRAFRKTALELFDRRWSVVSDLLVREASKVRGGNDETAPAFEVVEIKTKPGGHVFECYTADAKEAYGVVHAEPISGAKLAKRSQRAIAVPGLPLYIGDSGVPILPDWRLA
jgi:hypothetical protein